MTPASADAAGSSAGVSNVNVTAPRPAHRTAFRELLSELNPLQYLPVVGTLYRALTGDRISDEARTVGSLVVSGLTGGPVGIAISAVAMAVEKAVGIDPEKLGEGLLAEIGIGGAGKPAPASLEVPEAAVAALRSDPPPARATSWSPAQLAAYGVTSAADGTLTRGALQGADVLNDLELASVTGGRSRQV